MAKHKVEINIVKNEYAFIDGQTGQKFTKEEFDRKYRKVPSANMGILGGEAKTEERAGEAVKN